MLIIYAEDANLEWNRQNNICGDIIITMPKHILLVDDDALMRRSLAFHLEQAGYHVHTAANAEDALSSVRHSSPDLCLPDE
jgi:DNA-binding NtrC family response regulator